MIRFDHEQKFGFTLVELIVVIAIIGILIAVVVPSFSSFVDRGRFSNDVQSAASMTTILKNHFVLSSETEYDAHDIRAIIDSYHGGEYDYVPEANETGFFYLEGSHTIIASKYDDIAQYEDASALITQTVLINDFQIDENDFLKPQEVFGNDRQILTTSGSAVAEIIHAISHLADQGSAIQTVYDRIVSEVTSNVVGQTLSFFGYGISPDMRTTMLEFLDDYNPEKTIFVNNVDWITSADDLDDVTKVVFTPGMSNIPEFDLDLNGRTTVTSIEFPRTIKTVEQGAFPASAFNRSALTVKIKENVSVSAFAGELDGINVVSDLEVANQDMTTLIDFSDYIEIKEDGVYDLSLLKDIIDDPITGYNIFTVGEYYEILIYTTQGLVGFARNVYTVTYHYNHPSNNSIYFVSRIMSGVFQNTLINPEISGYVFGGWYTEPELINTISAGADLSRYSTDVYAKWNPAG